MPPSQLKRLKTSLREQGITGPQKSKKQKKQQRHGDNSEQRTKRNAALQGIRESFNPFEYKTLARPKKFDVTTSKSNNGKVVLGRPGVSKSLGEETRRKTLLPEMNKRNKVGGILDRRIGENDPTMTPDERAMARYTREHQRTKGASLFDLEEAEDELELTHGGRSLNFDDEDQVEDYDAASVGGSSDDEDGESRPLKRRRDLLEQVDTLDDDAPDLPERKKSKTEVMKEVIAKSKLHKYERQQAKEDDDEVREALDKELPDILAALRGHLNGPKVPPVSDATKDAPANDFGMDPGRAALLDGKSREEADKEYDARVRQMLHDQRSKPTERTKTEEEKVEEEANRLKELEESRLRRMRGEPMSESEDDGKLVKGKHADSSEDEDMDSIADDAAEFGLLAAAPILGSRPDGVEDEDDFLVNDDIVASGSEDDADFSDSSSEAGIQDDTMNMDEEDEFLKDVLPEKAKGSTDKATAPSIGDTSKTRKLAYTYPCPRSHPELLDILKDVAISDHPVVVQRIRALYHLQLHPGNKTKLADFSVALVDHISYMSLQEPAPSLVVVETLIRHIHSLSRTYPEQIATAFRSHLKKFQASNDPTSGDLTILTAIGSIYPTSDHFHQVVTPAITLMARWLGLCTPQTTRDVATGAYIGALCIRYQTLSKRYIPELVRYTLLALKSPHATPDLIEAHTKNLLSMANLWSTKTAFTEIFSPAAVQVLKDLKKSQALHHLQILLSQARLSRRPLQLHHHRPLPIKTQIPKFEESFDPNKHYDEDKERAESNKLRKEYKREKKGAMRELRKDANFIAREKLREKKERDRAYEQKYKRLVAEIQGEEGREKNAYEREKKARKRRG